MAGVIWLASYPKSGNTWVRALLAAHLEGAVDLNRLPVGGSALVHLSEVLGEDRALFRPAEVLALRPVAARWMAREAAGEARPVIQKVHMANLALPSGERAFPADAGRAVLVVRNPLDVAASWAPFFGVSAARAVAALADERFVLNAPPAGGYRAGGAPEPLGSWSSHAASWLDAPGPSPHVVRYEDLLADPAAALAGVLRFLGETPEAGRVAAAVEATGFERLRAAEAADGFAMHPPTATAPFFRRGRAGAWRTELPPDQARRVVADHGPTMRRLGYGAYVDEANRAGRTPGPFPL